MSKKSNSKSYEVHIDENIRTNTNKDDDSNITVQTHDSDALSRVGREENVRKEFANNTNVCSRSFLRPLAWETCGDSRICATKMEVVLSSFLTR